MKSDDVPGDERPPLARGLLELGSILELAVVSLVGARRVYTALGKEGDDARREVLIEVDPHRAKRTSPG